MQKYTKNIWRMISKIKNFADGECGGGGEVYGGDMGADERMEEW